MAEMVFTPITIKGMEMPNRFVRSATNDYMADKEGFVTDREIALYRELAEGGVGLIISAFLYIHPGGKSSPGQMGIYSDRHIDGLEKITREVHKTGAKIAAQIVHGGRQARPKLCGGETMAPSAVKDKKSGVEPREMTEEDIENAITWFTESADRAVRAGFDAVQLHTAHGYLLSQFISPYTNRRTDEWGGTTAKRARILVEIIRSIREITDEAFPLLVKMNASDFLPGGISLEESIETAKILDNTGIDGIEISGGMNEAEGRPTVQEDIDTPEKEAYFRTFAEAIKPNVRCPVILVGGMRSLSVMEEVLASGTADMVSLCRPFIREPDLVLKLKNREKTRTDCISCNRCFNLRGIKCPHVAKT
jgi:2,4-dienoyl-CoA reductase-like NADH-dependent reductase (Old Yellow Enzyme family)